MRLSENTPKPWIPFDIWSDAWNDGLSAVFSRWRGAHWVFASTAALLLATMGPPLALIYNMER